jgi:hypothetical protein
MLQVDSKQVIENYPFDTILLRPLNSESSPSKTSLKNEEEGSQIESLKLGMLKSVVINS